MCTEGRMLSIFALSFHQTHGNQFEARYHEINKSVPIAARKAQKCSGLKTLLRELSSDEEHNTDSSIMPSSSEDPEKLWKREYNAYMDTVHDVPEGMSTIQWWGVCAPCFCYLSVAYVAFSTIAIDWDQFGHRLLETTFQSWPHQSQVSEHSRKVV